MSENENFNTVNSIDQKYINTLYETPSPHTPEMTAINT